MNLLINEKVSYFLNIAVFGLVLSVATLWAPSAFVYGLATFIYGILGHVIDNIFRLYCGESVEGKLVFKKEDEKKQAWVHAVLFLAWLVVILFFLKPWF